MNIRASGSIQNSFQRLHIFLPIVWVALLFVACNLEREKNQTQGSTDTETTDLLMELNPKQKAAFDALDTLQVHSRGHLYSTFAGLSHACFPADTSYVLTQSELKVAIEEVMAEYGTDLSATRHDDIFKTCIQAQESYTVQHCFAATRDPAYRDFLKQNPQAQKTGVWVIPNVLGHRNIVLEW
jgi:hypothetical protein